jgi:hypothetical protein
MHFTTKITVEHTTKDEVPLDKEVAAFAEFVQALRNVAEHTPYMVQVTTEYDFNDYEDYSDAEQYRRPKNAS